MAIRWYAPEGDKIDLTLVEIDYHDMFGNLYRTVYPKGIHDIRYFEWCPPDALKAR